jgi:hypothetical protein
MYRYTDFIYFFERVCNSIFWNALAARPTSGSSLQVVFNVRNKDFGYGYNAATKA